MNILLIDDEFEPMAYYVRALQNAGFDVDQLTDPDAAIEYCERISTGSVGEIPQVVILDIMLPPGKAFSNSLEVEDGLRTGVLLYPILKNYLPNSTFFVLSNLVSPTFQSQVHNRMDNIPLLSKIETSPLTLVKLVQESVHSNP